MLKFHQIIILLYSLCVLTSAFQQNPRWNISRGKQHSKTMIRSSGEYNINDDCADNDNDNDNTNNNGRRSFVNSLLKTTSAGVTFATAMSAMKPTVANAGIDPDMLKNLSVQGDASGSAQRLRQIESIQRPPSDTIDEPYQDLPSGVSYREYREGKGNAVVQPGSKVAAEMTIRCKSFSNAKNPGGVKYFSTQTDTEFNELAWTVGNGELPPGLEEAMMGMRRNAVRRIEVPSTQVFDARNKNQLPLPTTKDGKKLFEERLFKTEATLLFEVLVTRVKTIEVTK
mmetsp:Transcript_40585/g.45344  ORF Transcript_40585/g.45344 Transcript_40585/m.45344 type:complete len:284 (+) Transcript_40585:102-953(+)